MLTRIVHGAPNGARLLHGHFSYKHLAPSEQSQMLLLKVFQ
jgi:hypothetical protein